MSLPSGRTNERKTLRPDALKRAFIGAVQTHFEDIGWLAEGVGDHCPTAVHVEDVIKKCVFLPHIRFEHLKGCWINRAGQLECELHYSITPPSERDYRIWRHRQDKKKTNKHQNKKPRTERDDDAAANEVVAELENVVHRFGMSPCPVEPPDKRTYGRRSGTFRALGPARIPSLKVIASRALKKGLAPREAYALLPHEVRDDILQVRWKLSEKDSWDEGKKYKTWLKAVGEL